MALEPGQQILLLTIGFFLIQGMWLAVITFIMFRRAKQRSQAAEQKHNPGDTYIEDVFLLHRSGLLIRHLSRRLKPHVDSDILTGMLRTVQEFVRDAFREGEGEEGELNQVGFGELKISICSGQHVVLATVLRGENPEEVLDQMKATVHDLEEKHADLLREWDGRMSKVDVVDDLLKKFLEGGYRRETIRDVLLPTP